MLFYLVSKLVRILFCRVLSCFIHLDERTTYVFFIGNKHCRITWDSKDDRSSAVTVYDTSSNGTWVCLLPSTHLS